MGRKKKEEPIPVQNKKVIVKSSLAEVEEYCGEVIYTYGTGDVIIKITEPKELVDKFPIILESPKNITYV